MALVVGGIDERGAIFTLGTLSASKEGARLHSSGTRPVDNKLTIDTVSETISASLLSIGTTMSFYYNAFIINLFPGVNKLIHSLDFRLKYACITFVLRRSGNTI